MEIKQEDRTRCEVSACVDFKDVFVYDETSPSCIRWKIDVFPNSRSGDVAGYLDRHGYYRVGFKNKTYSVHRIVILLHGKPLGNEVDHIDRNRSNNKIENLRSVSKEINQRNRSKNSNNTSGINGISLLKNKRTKKEYWQVRWYEGGVRKQKLFPTICGESEAKEAAIKFRALTIERLNAEGYDYRSC